MKAFRSIALVVLMVLVTGGCQLFASASRYSAAPSTVAAPFWCAPDGKGALSPSSCKVLSAQLDGAIGFAQAHFRAAQAAADGATGEAYQTGRGAAFRFRGPTSEFRVARPDTLLYDGTGAGAQVAGIEYNVAAAAAPAGFEGPNDTWTAVGGGVWRLRVWILRPFQDQRNAFAASHPCLASGGPVYDATAACYTTTHPDPLEILVSNDDGFDAAGIDTVVEALRVQPGVHVVVSAPAVNQSGSGSDSTDGPVSANQAETLSGYPVWSVDGFPVDAVRYAVRTRRVNPDLLVSGSNEGQNIGPFIGLSGTVGAAREGAQNAIPALAISQEGLGRPADFPSTVAPLLRWYQDFLYGRTGRPLLEPVTNINVPSCTDGAIRGTAVVPPATDFGGRSFRSTCTSTVTAFADDVDAFGNGFISVSTLSATSYSIT